MAHAALKIVARSRGQNISATTAKPRRGEVVVLSQRMLRRVSATKAKTLDDNQQARLLKYVAAGRHPKRDTVLVMLSFYCGLRAQEIAGVKWKRNVLNSDGKVGDVLHVTKDIGKRIKAREIPMNADLRAALRTLRAERPDDIYVVHAIFGRYTNSARGLALHNGQCNPNTLVQYLRRLYGDCGFVGCTSHSGRRTFGTKLARLCNTVGASLRDVQDLLGHASLDTTADYVEVSDQQHRLVGALI